MSLLDALLLDPPRIDIWLANRNDDASGSGVQNDPYNSSVRLDPVQAVITSVTVSGLVVTAFTTQAYAMGDVVQVTGATDPILNGVFSVSASTPGTSFTYRTNTTASVTTGTFRAQKVTQFRFDQIMSDPTKVGPNTCVHLGPGTVITSGYYEGAAGGWQFQAGMRLVGSGMDVTILRRVNNVAANINAFAIGHALVKTTPTVQANLVDFAEVSSLTVDCNYGELTNAGTAAGGVRLMGSHSRVLRVKVVNWGSKNSGQANSAILMVAANTSSGNALSNILGVTNCGIQGCIAVRPAASTTGTTVAFQVGPPSENAMTTAGFARQPYIRDCYVDGGSSTDVSKIGVCMSWCTEGVIQGNQIHNIYWGGPCQGLTTSMPAAGARDLTVRGNFYRNVAYGIAWYPLVAGEVQDLTVLSNSFELDVSTGSAFAIQAAWWDTTPLLVTGVLRVERNRVRRLDGGAIGGAVCAVCRIEYGDTVILRGNTVESVDTSAGAAPFWTRNCTSVTPFQNRSAAGILTEVSRYISSGVITPLQELQTEAEDAFMIPLLTSH